MSRSDQTTVVDFYWRRGCPFCMALRLSLKRSHLPIVFHDIWKDPEAAATVRRVAGGNETVPTVIIGGRALVNPTAGAVKRLFAEVVPAAEGSRPKPSNREPTPRHRSRSKRGGQR